MPYSEVKYKVRKKYIAGKEPKPREKYKFDKKIFFKWVSLSIILLGIFFVTAPWLFIVFEPQIDGKIKNWMQQSKGHKFEVDSFDYGPVRLTQGGLVFTQVRAHGMLRYEYPYFQPRQFDLYVPIMQVNFQFALRGGLRLGVRISGLEITGGELLPGIEESKRRLESISEASFQVSIPIGKWPWEWKHQVLRWAVQFKNWVFNGIRMKDIFLSGNATFIADGLKTKVFFFSRKERDGAAYLEGEANDLRRIARIIEPKFTDEDIAIASKNLLKTPGLLHLRTRADEKATALYEPGSEISYDTPRHIFWSYWLTQTFGPDFAFRVTNAHEMGDLQNTATEREKDRHNNALGIEYAQRQLSEAEVEKMILTDSRIPRNKAA